jgi:hypothetical protein
MRIIRYSEFSEKLSLSSTDSPALKMDKQFVNKTEEHINDYKSKKETITSLYTQIGKEGKFLYSNEMIKDKVEEMMGAEDDENRNPYLQKLITVLDLERKLIGDTKSQSDDKLASEDLRQELSNEKDDARKVEIQKKMDTLNKRLSEYDIINLTKQVEESKKKFFEDMNKLTQDYKTAVNKIKTTKQK